MYKITCLYLPLNLIYLLQLLDVSVFDPLKQNYKKLLAKKTCFLTYNINKADFISLIEKARQYGIMSQNIQLAWQATGLILYNLTIVFQILLIQKNNTRASSNTLIQTRFYLGVILSTPKKVK